MPWRELPHTADLLLEIEASDWPGLLHEATMALGAFFSPPQPEADTVSRSLRIEAYDREELLVRWLSEVLVWNELEGLVPVTLDDLHCTQTSAAADIRLAPATEPGSPIKAVTYHQLEVKKTSRGLRVRVLFDT